MPMSMFGPPTSIPIRSTRTFAVGHEAIELYAGRALSTYASIGVDRIVLIQMSYYQDDNRYMVDQIRKYPGCFLGWNRRSPVEQSRGKNG